MTTTLYHGTNGDFDAFDDAHIGSNPNTHINSHLGLWFAVASDWVGGFGSRTLEVEVELGHSYQMTVEELADLSHNDENGADFFIAMRKRLLAEGYDSIAIVEWKGRVDMYVALSADRVRSVRDFSPGPGPR